MIVRASALKHGITEADVREATSAALLDGPLDDENPQRRLRLGFDTKARLLEIVVLVWDDGTEEVIHSMKCRPQTRPCWADQTQSVVDVNLTSVFLVTRAVIAGMRSQGGGRVINVASTTGAVQVARDDLGYATAKAGVLGFTRALAVDEARRGITVNAVAPGWIAIAWLASPGASYITGLWA